MVTQILNGVERECSIFGALLKRELLHRFGARSLGWIEEVAAIAVHILAFTVLRLLLGGRSHGGMEILPFTVIGVMTFWSVRSGVSLVATTPGVMVRYTEFPQVSLLKVALARGVVNVALCLALAFAAFHALELLGYSRPIRDGFMVFCWLLLGGLLGIACGLALMWPFYVFPFARTVLLVFFMRVLAVVSGTFFVFRDLPYSLRPFARWMPTLHINDKAREAYFYAFRADWADPDFVTLTTTILFGLGLLSCDATRRRMARG